MSKLTPTTLGEVTNNFDNARVPLSVRQRENLEKKYRYYGAQGVIDYVDSYLFDGEYILVAEDGENLKSQKNNICNYVTGKFWVNNHAHIVNASNGHDTKYLYYKLSLVTFRNYVTGSAQPKLTKDNLNSIVLHIHKENEQKNIAAVLSALDAKIDCNARINSELEAMARTLYDYWFVQFDFHDANGKPYKSSGGKMVYNAVLKREIPAGWEATPLASITPVSNDSINPADFPKKEFRHFSIPVFDATKTYGVERGQSIGSNKFTVLGTDLLVSKLNPWFNRVVYAMDEADQICSTEFVVWRCPTKELKNFLYLIATSQQFISHCVQSATGTSNSHKRVNPTVMMCFDLPYQKEIAKRFGEKIAPFIRKMIANQREIKELTQLRDWLLPMLMNGQVTVG